MRSFTTDEELINFAHNVAILRRRHGLTKKAMAEILHVSLHSVNLLDKGRFPPRLKVEAFFHLGNYFHISVAKLMRERLESGTIEKDSPVGEQGD